MPFFTYILECSDKSLYVGSTNDLEKRLHQHNNSKSGAHYTKIRRPVSLVYKESCDTLGASRSREALIKRWSRKQKLELIILFNKNKLQYIPMAKRAATNTKNKTSRSRKTKKRLATKYAMKAAVKAKKRA